MNITATVIRELVDDDPRQIMVDDRILDVIDVEDRWYGAGYRYWKIFANDACHYLVKMDMPG